MTARVVGVDIARCLALLGMMATHILPGVVDGEVTVVQQVAGGRASALFAFLAGISLTFVAGTRGPVRGQEWIGYAAGLVVRSFGIALIGLGLGEIDSGIAVILTTYAALFVLAAPFAALSTPALAACAGLWVLVAPAVSHVLRTRVERASYEVPSFSGLDQSGQVLREVLLTGYYPAFTWLAYVLVGMVVGRLDLHRLRSAGVLALGGAAAWSAGTLVSLWLLARPGVTEALVTTFEGAGWQGDLDTTLLRGLYGVAPTGSAWWLAVRAPHTATTPDLLVTLGSAAAVLALALVLGRVAPRVTRVVFGAGAMTLSLYTLHVLLRREGWWDGTDAGTFLGQAALVLAVGAVFALLRRRGPLEAVLGEAARVTRKLFAGPPPVGSGS